MTKNLNPNYHLMLMLMLMPKVNRVGYHYTLVPYIR
jgi:hypothetical protein